MNEALQQEVLQYPPGALGLGDWGNACPVKHPYMEEISTKFMEQGPGSQHLYKENAAVRIAR